MSKKHYVMLAKLITQETDSINKDYLHKNMFVLALVEALKKDNPSFDGFRFIEACK